MRDVFDTLQRLKNKYPERKFKIHGKLGNVLYVDMIHGDNAVLGTVPQLVRIVPLGAFHDGDKLI